MKTSNQIFSVKASERKDGNIDIALSIGKGRQFKFEELPGPERMRLKKLFLTGFNFLCKLESDITNN